MISSASRRRWTIGVALCLAIVAWRFETTAHAHEIGTTRVTALFTDGRYEIEVVTDASTLLEKLEAVEGRTPPSTMDAGAFRDRLTRDSRTFGRRVKVLFDNSEVTAAIAFAITPGFDASSPSTAAIRLTGDVPAGAREFSWSYGWTFASYALTTRSAKPGSAATEWLEGGQRSAPFALASPNATVNRLGTTLRYLVLGFTHIVPKGYDHVLFVIGIYLLSGRGRSVLYQTTAFTIAHSITLALSMYGIVAVPPRIVEPLIAISIAYVAIENVVISELKSWRVALVFAFGLLHGMGFAGALKELGLPRSEFVTALLTFNLGVEAGQLTVIAVAFALVGWSFADRAWYRSRVVVPASLMIACVAVYWTIQRVGV